MYTHGHYLKVKTIILDFEFNRDAIDSKIIFKSIFYLRYLSLEVAIFIFYFMQKHMP